MDTKPMWNMTAMLLLAASAGLPAAHAGPYMDGRVGYDYYVSAVDEDGFEWVDADFYVERVVNDEPAPADWLSLAGWMTQDPEPSGPGLEAGYLPIDSIPAHGAREVFGTVAANDIAPGEYFVHVLLQDDRFPGSFDDSIELPPTLLWRGGLEAIGPLNLYQYQSGRLEVDFERLDNRRIDARYTEPVRLTLFATYGFGPASEGLVLCEKIVPGIYAGESRFDPGFSCYPEEIPDGEYTVHLEVAEAGGRGGWSTLSGPDAYFSDGWIDEFYGCDRCFSHYSGVSYGTYYAAGLGFWLLAPLLLIGGLRMKTNIGGALRGFLAAVLLLPGAAGAAQVDSYSDAELDQLLAPVALYPDSVLSHVMIAATYPLEVAQAARWSRAHPDLRGDEALDAVAHKDWDDSVKALVAFPEILERMDEDLDWTQRLGEAFLAQEADVLDRVQYLRQRADAEGHLESDERVEVVREKEVIYIEPAVRERIYVPYYDPWVVYGSWWWPAYPPYAWSFWAGHPVAWYHHHHHYHHGFYWGPVVYISPFRFHFVAFHWHHHRTVVVPRAHRGHHWASSRDIARHSSARRWSHDPQHRRHVEYRHERLSHRSDARVQRREAVRRESRLTRGSRDVEPTRAHHGGNRRSGMSRSAAQVEARLQARSDARVGRRNAQRTIDAGRTDRPSSRGAVTESSQGANRSRGYSPAPRASHRGGASVTRKPPRSRPSTRAAPVREREVAPPENTDSGAERRPSRASERAAPRAERRSAPRHGRPETRRRR